MQAALHEVEPLLPSRPTPHHQPVELQPLRPPSTDIRLNIMSAVPTYELLVTAKTIYVSHVQGTPGTLQIDRSSGTMSIAAQPGDTRMGLPTYIDAVYGVFRFQRGHYLVVVTESEPVGEVLGHTVLRVVRTRVIPFAAGYTRKELRTKEQQELERMYLTLLQWSLNHHLLYYCHSFDLSNSMQRTYTSRRQGKRSSLSPGSPLTRSQLAQADRRMWWNYNAVAPLVAPDCPFDMSPFVRVFISGYVSLHSLKLTQDSQSPVTLGLISRRDRRRTGRRYLCRGVDADGAVANFAETEQILVMPDSEQPSSDGKQGTSKRAKVQGHYRVLSYLQTRGSIPLRWWQVPDGSRKPLIEVVPSVFPAATSEHHLPDIKKQAQSTCQLSLPDVQAASHGFAKHVQETAGMYGQQTCVNLLDQKKKEEAELHAQWERAVGEYCKKHPGSGGSGGVSGNPGVIGDGKFSLISFDFHHQCKKMRYENVGKLVNLMHHALQDYGMFGARYRVSDVDGRQSGSFQGPAALQSGVVRTNCKDSLDRTNLLQSFLAKLLLGAALAAAGAGDALPLPAPGFIASLKPAVLGAAAGAVEQKSNTAPSTLPDFRAYSFAFASPWLESLFKNMWADNADAMSIQYAGTGALKTDFTRTGKRTFAGLLQDGSRSLRRFYFNNFVDGWRQDAVDLLTGRVAIRPLTALRLFGNTSGGDGDDSGGKGSDGAKSGSGELRARGKQSGNDTKSQPQQGSSSAIDDAAVTLDPKSLPHSRGGVGLFSRYLSKFFARLLVFYMLACVLVGVVHVICPQFAVHHGYSPEALTPEGQAGLQQINVPYGVRAVLALMQTAVPSLAEGGSYSSPEPGAVPAVVWSVLFYMLCSPWILTMILIVLSKKIFKRHLIAPLSTKTMSAPVLYQHDARWARANAAGRTGDGAVLNMAYRSPLLRV